MASKYKRKDMYLVPVEDLTIENGFNQRFDYGDLNQLALSIKENGVVQPLYVYAPKDGNGKLLIIDGHRRFKAAKLAKSMGWDGLVPVLKTGRGVPTEEERTLAIITHNGGKPLNALEEGMVYRKLYEIGLNNSEISRKVGKSVTHVISCSSLLDLNEPLIDKIKSGTVTATMVLEQLKDISEEELNTLIEEAVSSKELKKVTKKHLKKKETSETRLREVKPTYSIKDIKEKVYELKKRFNYIDPKVQAFVQYLEGTMTAEEYNEIDKM